MRLVAALVCLWSGVSCLKAAPAPCPSTGTYATLMNLNSAGGCTVDALVFSNFTFSSSQINGAPQVSASDLDITDLVDSPPGSIGFAFGSIPIMAMPGQASDVTVGYTVASVTGALLIAGADLTEAGRATPDTGNATIDETVNAVALHTDFNATPVSMPSDSAVFSAVAAANVTDHIRAAGGIIGTADISGFSNTFDEAPEPISALLLLLGLTGIAVRRTL
ncbi:MAG TPA: hypothetical protein VKB88_23665 [Bryobacteraceae bacterium]|nr:hypothetical protein [Bryobacteraceae bacterium]